MASLKINKMETCKFRERQVVGGNFTPRLLTEPSVSSGFHFANLAPLVMNFPIRFLNTILLLALMTLSVYGQAVMSISEKTSGMDKRDGFFPLYWSEATGDIYLEIRALDQDFIYVTSMPAGLGSNDIGLDRSQLGSTRVVRFERSGSKILLVMPNLRYRAESESPAERASVQEAFAEAVIWGFTVEAEEEGNVLVKATDFVVQDANGVVRRLKAAQQGSFALDKSRSAPIPSMLKAFPENTEMEARITFTSSNPGPYVRDVAADPYSVTLSVRHSFVMLPDSGYTPREFHPGAGYGAVSYMDYAVPIGEDMMKRYIRRHRLVKQNPGLEISDPVSPIVYYLDPGTPEPVRGALLDGARWWSKAFEAAGFSNAFRIEILPEGADPMDVRYNTIQWVHRATRGWSYGASVVDPRTGEIIKGHVTLGSLRVRQDYLIAEGLLAPYTDSIVDDDPMLSMSLARIRQLSAHEVGHTLGLSHNFTSSANRRASVMDYPAPYAVLGESGEIDLDAAYTTGVGEWDKVAIAYGYVQPMPDESEQELLSAILQKAWAQGLQYITDADARPTGAAHPLANLWDNGDDMVRALYHEMEIRNVALARFGEEVIRKGRPLATMEEVLVPLYLRHRYQVEATAKLLGGVTYTYAMRGDGQASVAPVEGEVQQAALQALLTVVSPSALRVPESVRMNLPPRPPGYLRNRELFQRHTGLTFDSYSPAAAVATLVFTQILNPERAARMVYQTDLDAISPDFHEVMEFVSDQIWGSPISDDPYEAELQRVVQQVWIDELIGLASNRGAAPPVRAIVLERLREFKEWIPVTSVPRQDHRTRYHRKMVLDEIERYLLRDYEIEERRVRPGIPPGSPIGVTIRREMLHAFLNATEVEWCSH